MPFDRWEIKDYLLTYLVSQKNWSSFLQSIPHTPSVSLADPGMGGPSGRPHPPHWPKIWAGEPLHAAVTKHRHTHAQPKPDKMLNIRHRHLICRHVHQLVSLDDLNLAIITSNSDTTIRQFSNTDVHILLCIVLFKSLIFGPFLYKSVQKTFSL